jgi:hypothetical protein
MTESIEFIGVVDAYHVESKEMRTTATIGGRDVIATLEQAGLAKGLVRVTLWLEGAEDIEQVGGEACMTDGWTGTDVTPAEPHEVLIGDYDLLARLARFHGRQAAMAVERA